MCGYQAQESVTFYEFRHNPAQTLRRFNKFITDKKTRKSSCCIEDLKKQKILEKVENLRKKERLDFVH